MQDGDTALIKAIVSGTPVMGKLLIGYKDHQNKANRMGVVGLQFSAFAFGGMQTSYTMILFLGQIASKIVFLLSAVRSGSLLCVSKKGNHSQNG